MHERELVERLNAGDGSAFAEIFDAFGKTMFRTAFSLSGSRQDAEDAVQDVFVSIARMKGRMAGIVNLKSYIFASLRHAIAKRAAHAGVVELGIDENGCPEDRSCAGNPPAVSAALEHALSRLPEEQRQVVAYKIDAGMTFEEIGMALGISPNTAASRWRYAIDRLKGDLEGVQREQ